MLASTDGRCYGRLGPLVINRAGMNHTFTRRKLLWVSMALMASGCVSMPRDFVEVDGVKYDKNARIDPKYHRQRVRYDGTGAPGSIVVDTNDKFLYLVEGEGWATRYGVGVGQAGLSLKGQTTVGHKAVWPSWTPTENMMRRKPRLVQYAGGVPGGPDNPLGARALYLYRGGEDTMFRLHGTNEPWSIGRAMSSGCVRLLNDDIIDLYERTPQGTSVFII
jgi:lipoprotein-anchoring transpeptidase ErfK/SrfK